MIVGRGYHDSNSTLAIIVILALSSVLAVAVAAQPEETDKTRITEFLSELPGTIVKEIEPTKPFTTAYEIWIKQPLDHKNPSGQLIWQRMFLSHVGLDRPLIFETDGYGISWPKTRELARLLNANQLIVEHRYWGVSRPDSIDWKYLSVQQAADDHHRIVSLLKPLYTRSWISTGRSKGGMAALFHKALYPEDVEATVAFVAPVMLELEDPRYIEHIESKTNDEWWGAVEQFQITALQRRDSMLSLLDKQISQSETSFAMSSDTLLEFMITDYATSFYGKHGTDFSHIPKNTDGCKTLFDHLIEVANLPYYTTGSLRRNAPLIYQCLSELGNSTYPTSHIDSLLISLERPAYSLLSPTEDTVPYNGAMMRSISEQLVNATTNVIYLYGDNDYFTACAVQPSEASNCLKKVLSGKGHVFNLDDLPESDYREVLDSLQAWTLFED